MQSLMEENKNIQKKRTKKQRKQNGSRKWIKVIEWIEGKTEEL